MNFRRLLFVSLLLGAIAPVAARAPADPPGQDDRIDKVVNSMLASGTIEIDTGGRVAGYTIRNAEAYDQALLDMMGRNIQRWVFKPVLVDGVPRNARFDMYLRLQAKPLDNGQFEVGIASAAFGSKEPPAPHTRVGLRGKREPPRYPADELRKGVAGTVVLILKVGPSGDVLDAVAEQTNLTVVGRDGAMDQWRRNLERAALFAARRWSFEPPTAGEEASKPWWNVRTSVIFTFDDVPAHPAPGQWERYVPGPRHAVPWLAGRQTADSGVDALPGGGIYPMEQPLHLLTKLNPE